MLVNIDDVRAGSLVAALALMFFPDAYGVYSPFAIRALLRSAERPASYPTIYGVSTCGLIAGTLGTTFFCCPRSARARLPHARRCGSLWPVLLRPFATVTVRWRCS